MSTEPNPNVTNRWLLSAAEAAELLGISQRHLWALHSSGRLPRPVRLGRSVRWNRAELLAWIEQACPAREEWDALGKGGAG